MMAYLLEFYNSFRRTNGYVVTVIGTIITFVAWLYKPDFTISLNVFVPLIALLLICLFTLFDLSHRLFIAGTNILPKVRQAVKPSTLFKGSKALLILENSSLYAHDSLVTIFRRNTDYEELVATGFVLTIQQNGLIQVVVNESLISDDDIWQGITNNDRNELSKIVVKPIVLRSIIEKGAQ